MFFQLWGDYWQSVGKDWGVTLYLGTGYRTFPCLASGREGGSGIKLHVVYIRVHISVWQCYLLLHLGLLPLCSYRISRLSTAAGLTSAQPSRHIFPVHRAQRWHVQAKARNVSQIKDWNLTIFVCIVLPKQLPAMRIPVWNYPLQMQIKKMVIAPQKTFLSLCSLREVGANQWGNIMAHAPLW